MEGWRRLLYCYKGMLGLGKGDGGGGKVRGGEYS